MEATIPVSSGPRYRLHLFQKVCEALLPIEAVQEKILSESAAIVSRIRAARVLDNTIRNLSYAKLCFHTFLERSELSLIDQEFNYSDSEVRYLYKFQFQPKYLFRIVYRVETSYVVVNVDRLLRTIENDITKEEIDGSMAYAIEEFPTFEDNTTPRDTYKVYKLLMNATSKVSRMWSKFPNSNSDSGSATPPDLEDLASFLESHNVPSTGIDFTVPGCDEDAAYLRSQHLRNVLSEPLASSSHTQD